MIKFFRRIRQQLLSENKFSKYLIYAIGEILLVVIGILIALQVNNWNEENKNRRVENQILSTIKENLTNDLDDFEKNLITLSNRIISCEVLINCSRHEINYHDSLAFHLFYTHSFPHFTPNMSGYELLKSQGIELISNDSLKLAITNLYEYGYKYLFTWELEQINTMNYIYIPMIRPYLGSTPIGEKAIPHLLDNSQNQLTTFATNGIPLKIENFTGLTKDMEVQSFLAHIKGVSSLLKHVHGKAQNDVINVIKKIEKDLK